MKQFWGDVLAQFVSGRIAAPVADTTALAAIPAANRVDGMVCITLDTYSCWVCEARSATAGSATCIAPSAGTGRWFRCFVAATS